MYRSAHTETRGIPTDMTRTNVTFDTVTLHVK